MEAGGLERRASGEEGGGRERRWPSPRVRKDMAEWAGDVWVTSRGRAQGAGWAKAAVNAVLAVGGKHDPKATYKFLPAK